MAVLAHHNFEWHHSKNTDEINENRHCRFVQLGFWHQNPLSCSEKASILPTLVYNQRQMVPHYLTSEEIMWGMERWSIH